MTKRLIWKTSKYGLLNCLVQNMNVCLCLCLHRYEIQTLSSQVEIYLDLGMIVAKKLARELASKVMLGVNNSMQ